jgi:FixJ family two-component response regulator
VSESQTVFLVDDDSAMRESMTSMFEQAGFRIRSFPSAQAFLNAYSPSDHGCLVLDLRMPGMTGLELQEALLKRGANLPVVFLSGYGDIPTTVRAIKRGAIDFLEKPVAMDILIGRVRQALGQDRKQRAARAWERLVRHSYANLSARERQVMALVTQGLANKEIARHLGISPRTVENHRARVMEKMQADSIADLCRMAALCLASDQTPAV